MFAKSSTDEDLRKAKPHVKKGEVTEACDLYHSVIHTFLNKPKI